MEKQGTRNVFAEYLIAQAIENANDNNGLIKYSQGRKIRNDIIGHFGSYNFQMKDLLPVMNQKLAENLNGYQIQNLREFYDMKVKEFNDYLISGVVPIPIYDGRYARNEVVKLYAPNQLFIRVDDVDEMADGNFGNLRKDEIMQKFDVVIPRGNYEPAVVGKLASKSDLSGVSQLAQYMTQDEYRNVVDWVNLVGESNPEAYMSQKAINRSIAILKYLNDQGTSYVVERDANVGQIKARLVGTNLSVRLTDSRENEHFVGRVTDRGAAIYYMTDYKNERGQMDEYKDITDIEAIRLLRFAQGYAIADQSSEAGEKGVVGVSRQYQIDNGRMRNAVYYTDKNFSAVVKDYKKPEMTLNGYKVFIHVSSAGHFRQTRFFKDVTDAQSFLKTSVDNARNNYANRFDLEKLIAAYHEHKDDPDYMYDYSYDDDVAQLQQKYWSFLSGQDRYLVNPWLDENQYLADKAEWDAAGLPDLVADEVFKYDENAEIEEMVRNHFNNVLDVRIGQYEPKVLPYYTENNGLDYKQLRFDPIGVGKFMTSEFGAVRNNRDIIAAMRLANIDVDELQGSDYYNSIIKDNMIRFDEMNARDMSQLTSPFMRNMYRTTYNTLRRSGVTPDRILIDDNGIIRYTGQIAYSKNLNKGASKPIMGEIGQIFEPEADGSIVTKYAGSTNHVIVPGYEAMVVPQKEGENLSYIERTRLKGYERLMREALQYQIRTDLIDVEFQDLTGNSPEAGTTTALNGVYRRLYDERHDLDYHDKELAVGLDEDLLERRMKTEASRVKYLNKFGTDSTINADFQARNGLGVNPRNDNFVNVYELTGNENLSVMRQELSNGYFDPIATSSGTNQGITRYLVESAQVDPTTGEIIKGDENDRTSIMKHPFMKNQEFNPFDRQQMTFSNLMTASGVNTARAAMIDLHGLTFEDGVPMSKEYAERHGVYAADGQIRRLLIGDKVSDGNGNKGVTPYIIDRNMSDEEYNKLSPLYQRVVDDFRRNPDLEIALAKYSPVSRFNGGTARDMLNGNKAPFIDKKGVAHEDSISDLPIIVTHMTVDAKTNIYDSSAILNGRGRKASPQLAWGLNALDADGIMAEFYGNNNKAIYNYREFLITVGLDMDEVGTLREGYQPHSGEERVQMNIPDLIYRENGMVDQGQMKLKFAEMLNQNGGFLAIPFELKFPNGELMQKNENGETLVPILSSHLRSGQEFVDGTSMNHDYTNHYLSLYVKCVQYLDAKDKLENGSLDAKKRAIYEKRMTELPIYAQEDYNRVAKDIIKRQFEGKHNYIRDGIMSNRLSHSATAVWTANPDLDVDCVAISPAIAANLNVSNGDYIAVWRDPVIADGGVRGLKVVIDENLVGCAINPVAAQSFEGDFDGDSVALVACKTAAAKRDLRDKLSQAANILDQANFVEIAGKKVHPINLNFGLELKVYATEHPEFSETLDDITLVLNDTLDQYKSGLIDRKEMLRVNRQAVQQISTEVREAFIESSGRPISFKDMESHLQSIYDEVIATGAKGSVSKLQDYMKYLGVEGSISDDGKVNVIKDHGKPLTTAEDYENTGYAVAVKSYGTGIAGKYSQRGVAALRNYACKEILDLTHPVTQSVLQAKHDPIDARHKYGVLMTTARSIWRGQSVEQTTNHEGESVWVKSDDRSQMRADLWVDKFCEFYESSNGLNIPVNRDQVERLAKVLSDKDGYMMDIETEALGELGATLDRLSYTPSYKLLQELASEKRNLFEGKYTAQFAPSVIQQNKNALKLGENTKALVKQDVIMKQEQPSKSRMNVSEPKSNIPDVVADNGRASREALIEQMLNGQSSVPEQDVDELVV